LLERYAEEVEPNDRGNREGLAAKQYFHVLFWPGFTRELECEVNAALNYGYQILLSVFSRELTCEGYLTQLGIFHDSVYNPFNLASDLMEPFRPYVDCVVKAWFREQGNNFSIACKRRLVSLLHEDVMISGARQTLINAVILYVRSVTEALQCGCVEKIRFPER
jgi:CRISPR-associated endonuclease Cas1 subtype II